MLKKQPLPRRNERCWCGSGKKFKNCCLALFQPAVARPERLPETFQYIDSGEPPVRFVIVNDAGTGFFSTKDNQIIVFSSRDHAAAVVGLSEFSDQAPGEINVAGVGASKWEHLKETLPFVEVASVEEAVALIQERIAHMQGVSVAAEPSV